MTARPTYLVFLAAITLTVLQACGDTQTALGLKKKKSQQADAVADNLNSEVQASSPSPIPIPSLPPNHPPIFSTPDLSLEPSSSPIPTPSLTPSLEPKFSCGREKSDTEFVTTTITDMFRRAPTKDEIGMAAAANFSRSEFVKWAIHHVDFETTGISHFVSNLLRINSNLIADNDNEAALYADLAQEPVVLVQRFLDKPWPDLFTTKDFFCTARTGPLYGYPVDANTSGFVSCKMEAERSGILGLISVLRAYSSAFYTLNNNYHRNALAVYLAQGLELAAKTDGPVGDGLPPPLPNCVPKIDNRVSNTGLIFGSIAVPHSGPVCASCHIPYHAEMVSGFLVFGPKGEILTLGDVESVDVAKNGGIPRSTLKDIFMNSGRSCWTPNNTNDVPQSYAGLPGLSRLIAGSTKLPRALAIQIQKNWMNTMPNEFATMATIKGYEANGKSLRSALTGYLLSEVYQCSSPAKVQ